MQHREPRLSHPPIYPLRAGPEAGDPARGARPLPPADLPPRAARDRGPRGARPLEAPDPWAGAARPVRSPRGGVGPGRAAWALGVEGGVPSGGPVAGEVPGLYEPADVGEHLRGAAARAGARR